MEGSGDIAGDTVITRSAARTRRSTPAGNAAARRLHYRVETRSTANRQRSPRAPGASGMSRSKIETASPSLVAVDAEASSESAVASPRESAVRQRGSGLRASDSGSGICRTRHTKVEGSRRRQLKSLGASPPTATGGAQPVSRRGSRASSVAFATDDFTPCVAASTVSRVSSPSVESCRSKRGPGGPKGSPDTPEHHQSYADERTTLPAGPGQSFSSTATASLRVSHRNWQSNCVLLYKHIMSHILEWPTLSVQWLHSCNP